MKYSSQNPFPRRPSPTRVARGLGLFSLGLGLAEVMMPDAIARSLGMPGKASMVRAFGWREIVAGAGLLMAGHPRFWVWKRVAGDALDLSVLASALHAGNPHRATAMAAFAAVAGVTALDLGCARALQAEERRRNRPWADYSDRSGLPQSPEAMRGVAADLELPRDMRTPEALRPYGTLH
ncbi:hypothetical protein M8A51_09410 [Schlegelella sp. S2-27]|uniref:Cyclase dehydrase n=1 Tax=Caldimonas mangrovi TaxID=2944811 RepID=A0ABT0YLZ4_9BURK|nr:hypothetical protein [Caldimonas mangrovi]MCM5679752.1 hypothetical protein [Caldimonas mangrovi]